LSLSDQNFNEVISALREVLSIEGEFDVIQRSHEKQECYIVTKTGNTHIRTPLNVASSGFRTVLAMVCDILQGLMDKRLSSQFARFEEARGVVLIDEVETHLHPRWKMQIMGGLRRALPGVTFIATTHDPLCLRGMRNGEVIVMRRVVQAHNNHDHKENQKIEVRSDLPDITKMRVDQLLTSDFFQLSSTDEPEMEQQLAQIADLLAKRERKERLDAFELEALNSFERDIASAMPVGTSEAHRIVQEAVALYLQERRKVTAER
jgi:ABC-type glutathione transport system ATPase component